MGKNKKLISSVTAIVIALIFMASTFAWQQTVHKINEFKGEKTDVILHDDFDPATGAKDVYVENPNSVDIFVRVKLNEYMDLTSNTAPASYSWQTHKYNASAANCGNSNLSGKKFHDYFTWEMGGQKYYNPGDKNQSIVQDTNIYGSGYPQTPYVNPVNGIITASEYLAMSDNGKTNFIGWIYDTDGYAYWSQPLGKDQVTGLLLHKVNTNSVLNDTDYYYAIDVIVEAVDVKDIPMWTSGAASVDPANPNTYPSAANPGIINFIKTLSVPIAPPATQPPTTTQTPTESPIIEPGSPTDIDP